MDIVVTKKIPTTNWEVLVWTGLSTDVDGVTGHSQSPICKNSHKQVQALWLCLQRQLLCFVERGLFIRLLLHCWNFNLVILSHTDEGY